MGGSITGRAVAILLLALTLVQNIPAASPETPPASGEWQIYGPVVLENGTFHINGSVYVWSNGSLTVRNATLVFDRYCTLLAEGPLVMTGSSVHPAPNVSQGAIKIRTGTANFTRCSFDNISFDVNLGAARFSGCNITGYNSDIYQYTYGTPDYSLEVYNCTFIGTASQCIVSDSGGLAVLGCRFFNENSDIEAFDAGEPTPGPAEPGARVLDNQFSQQSIGIEIGSSTNYYPIAIGFRDDHEPRLIRGNIFKGFGTGVMIEGYCTAVKVDGNRLAGCGLAIDAAGTNAYNMEGVVSNNTIEGGETGIRVWLDSIEYVNNSISNCTNSGFNWDASLYGGGGPVIRHNNITSCRYGAYFLNLAPQFINNSVSDCAAGGIYYSIATYYSYNPEISNNTFINCGFAGGQTSGRTAAVTVYSDDRTTVSVSRNRILSCPAAGILADGGVRIDNNTVEEVATGVECANTWKARQEIFKNRVSGGEVGILLRGISSVTENDISRVGTGILCDLEGSTGDLQLSSNAVHSAGRGIVVRNTQGAVRSATITGNVLAAAIDGVLVDSAHAIIDLNDFGGTFGVCVHAIGLEPAMSDNSFGRSCAGWVLQEYYLTVRALESADQSGASWSYTDRFSARVRNDAGELVLNAGSGEGTVISANLTGHTIDREGVRTNFTRYSVTAAKPRVGVGWAAATLVENTNAAINLVPRYDLAVQDIVLPGGRPVPDQTATVEVSVVHDSTYDTFFTPVSAVNVALRDNGVPIGEKQIARLEPNATATVLFPWYVYGGLHELTAIVDPDMRLPEAFEDNNAFTRKVAVNEVPVPVLAVSDRSPAAGRTVAFSSAGSTDDRGVARSLFEFGDGTDSGWTEDSTVLHVYRMPGIYEARLRVSDGEDVASGWSLPEYIKVTEGRLEAGLAANSTAFATLVPVLLSATPEGTAGAPMSYWWDFGDGASEMGALPRQSHTFLRAGNYTASVTVMDQLGRRGAASVVLSVRNRPPVAALAFAPAGPTVLGPVQFSSESADPDGVTVGWRWDFGDGNRSSDPAPRHLYTGKGDYTVTLEVQDDSGAWSAAASERLSVRNTPPSARATVSASTVRTGETVRLDARLSSDPDDGFASLSFVWSSPEGWSAAGPGASRSYDAPGRYRMTLTVTDGWGASSQDTVTVQVLPAGETGEPDSRGPATALSASAVAVFLAALFIYGRDRTGPAGAPPPNRSVKGAAGGKTKRNDVRPRLLMNKK